jgi:predicted chitinase
MTSNPAPNTPQTPPAAHLKQLAFAFPFQRKAQGRFGASVPFTDEHDIYRLLAQSEPSGSYLVSRKGMWHGGIHVTEAGAGQALDLDAGLRCIADGTLIAWRANRDYPVSELAMDGSNTPFQAPYSTGFALVRHEMEFPRGTTLTFYSLYMHLMSNVDYDSNFPKRQKPAYWSRQWQVTQHAQDKPLPGPGGHVADPLQMGLHVRKTPNGSVLGILPQGASVSIGKTETVHGTTWGQLTDLNGATLYAPVAGGYVAPSVAITGWIYLGVQNGGPVAKENIPDSIFDRVIVTTNQTCSPADPQGTGGGIPVKAGDLMGHLGRYDSLDRRTTGTRMAHIEVFCDEGIRKFIKDGCAWVNANCANPTQWSQLGLSADPTILRVDRGTTLYHDHGQQGQDAKQTDVVQTYAFAALPQDAAHLFTETAPGDDGQKLRWWKVGSADMQRNAITGWVREQSFAGGRVTREFSQSWIDFECHDEDHDPAHTVFATTGDYVDYALGSDAPGAGSLGKLSPLMAAIYRVLYPSGDGAHAADELCGLGQNTPGAGFPWIAFRASRLVPKHESEWAKPAKWQELVSAIEQRTGPKPEHEEEKKRIARLAWWDEVQAGVAAFPGPEVYHINPVGLVGNFLQGTCSCNKDITEQELDLLLPSDVKSKGLFHAAHDPSVHGFDKGKFLDLLNNYLRGSDMMTCVRKVHFLSQMSHECDELRTNEEYRNKDGSIPSGWNNYHGGSNFHGRGLIQLTHNTNYIAYGKYVGDTTIGTNPNQVSNNIDHTTHSACWYWRHGSHWGDINLKADDNDFYAITVAVNGGFNHVDDRFVALNKLAKSLGAEKCTTNPGLIFNDYQIEKSSLYGTNFYKTHTERINEAVEAVDAKKSKI